MVIIFSLTMVMAILKNTESKTCEKDSKIYKEDSEALLSNKIKKTKKREVGENRTIPL
jgi:hypothetical protein